ncbi:MAG: DNA repair protein RecN [Deltaproteobacteria bacterium]|nr:DNA repair protein RecN [Deltaproteobacteria bacterium]
MLRSLRVNDFALIEDLVLGFGAGLNAVTGETGAGKSLLQRALAIAAGHRAGSEMVRAGCDAARVEAVFALGPAAPGTHARLEALGIPASASGEIRIRRTIARNGRSQVVINDRPATVATLLEIGSALIHLQGQHESLRLTQAETHLEMLDQAAGTEAEATRYRANYGRLTEIVTRLDGLERGAAQLERRLEIARFDFDELQQARLDRADEEATLTAERMRLRNVEKLALAANEAVERLHAADGAALATVQSMARRLGELAVVDTGLEDVAASLEQAAEPLADAVRGLLDYVEGLESDPQRLEEIEERLALLARLVRKHGVADVAGLIDRREALREEIASSASDLADPTALRAELERAADEAWRVAGELSAARRRGAERLAQAMEAELGSLGMGDARFTVRFEPLPPGPSRGAAAVLTRGGAAIGPQGLDWVEFDLAANPGEGARPLARIASGGELSRIMLALRNVAGGAAVPTLVFDEVDAGIGGATAEIVGRRLHALVRRHQVISITHLAQIAAFADHHYAVVKDRDRGRTRTRVLEVTGGERVAELARMLSGSASAAARAHAEELLAGARQEIDSQAAERGARAPGAGPGGRPASAAAAAGAAVAAGRRRR